MICPYCEQGRVIKAKIKKNGRIINICEECDTVWKGEIDLLTGISFEAFMKKQGYEGIWNELEVEN